MVTYDGMWYVCCHISILHCMPAYSVHSNILIYGLCLYYFIIQVLVILLSILVARSRPLDNLNWVSPHTSKTRPIILSCYAYVYETTFLYIQGKPGRGRAYQLITELNPSGWIDQNPYLNLHAWNKNTATANNGTSVWIKIYLYERQKVKS